VQDKHVEKQALVSKMKKTKHNIASEKFLIFVGVNSRVFTFSAHNGADQRMWIRAFEILLELKSIAMAFKKGMPLPENSMAEYANKQVLPACIVEGLEQEDGQTAEEPLE